MKNIILNSSNTWKNVLTTSHVYNTIVLFFCDDKKFLKKYLLKAITASNKTIYHPCNSLNVTKKRKKHTQCTHYSWIVNRRRV